VLGLAPRLVAEREAGRGQGHTVVARAGALGQVQVMNIYTH
jgi:hypothetical protein